ncbi:hypothetical protein [Trueperella sp. LYQ141]|uniref:hypothetical protein n=1 Tax=Trueperella sp. LYQ141 TaxID=3391058 RepID=UPI0039836ADD
MLVGATARKKEVHDERELYLLLESSSFAAVLTLEPDKGQEARRFLQSAIHADRNAQQNQEKKEESIKTATAELEAAEKDTQAIEEAQDVLARARANTGEVEQAHAIVMQNLTEEERNQTPTLVVKTPWIAAMAASAVVLMIAAGAFLQPDTSEEAERATGEKDHSISSATSSPSDTSSASPTPTASASSAPTAETSDPPVAAPSAQPTVSPSPAHDYSVPPTDQQVLAAFQAWRDERAGSGVRFAQAITEFRMENGMLTAIVDPAAGNMTSIAFDEANPFENFAEFVGVPISMSDPESEWLRKSVSAVQAVWADGSRVDSMTADEIHYLGTRGM